MKKMLVLICFVGLLAAPALYAAAHPHLAKAQNLIHKAYDRITAAQKANEFDMGGHAKKAKEYLEEASQHLKAAAIEATENEGEKEMGKHAHHATAPAPGESASEAKHPNLAEAQELIDEAFTHITEAQKANEYDMEGHAAKAKDALEKASAELKLAANKASH